MATQKPAKKVAAKKPAAKPAVKATTKVAVKAAIKAPAKSPAKKPPQPTKPAAKAVAKPTVVAATTDVVKSGKVATPPVKSKPKAGAKPVAKTSTPEKTILAGGYPQGQIPHFGEMNKTPHQTQPVKKVGVQVSDNRVKFKDLVAKAKQPPTFGRTVPAKTGQAKILANMQASLMKTKF